MGKMMFEDVMDRVEMTRLRIEPYLKGASVINVSSSRVEDSSAVFAKILAYSFARAGQSTLLVEHDSSSASRLNGASDPEILPKIVQVMTPGSPDVLNLDLTVPRSAAVVKDLYCRLKSLYTVVLTSQTLADNGGLGLTFASQSDAIVIGVKKGRSITDSDRQLNELLSAGVSPVVGVVLIDGEAVKVMTSLPSIPVPVRSIAEKESGMRRKALNVKVG